MENEVQRFPMPIPLSMHNFQYYQCSLPQWHNCSNWWAFLDTSLSPKAYSWLLFMSLDKCVMCSHNFTELFHSSKIHSTIDGSTASMISTFQECHIIKIKRIYSLQIVFSLNSICFQFFYASWLDISFVLQFLMHLPTDCS